jgi:hypothetical protein
LGKENSSSWLARSFSQFAVAFSVWPLLHPDHGLAVQPLQAGRLQLQSLLEMSERRRQLIVLQAKLADLCLRAALTGANSIWAVK